MAIPITLNVTPSAGTMAWSARLSVAEVYNVSVVLAAAETENVFDPLKSYSITAKQRGNPSGDPIGGPWALTYVDSHNATFEMDLGIEALYTLIGNHNTIQLSFGLDSAAAGPLGFQDTDNASTINNSNRRPADVPSPATGTAISAEEVTALIASAIASVEAGALDITALTAREDALSDSTLEIVQETTESAPKKSALSRRWTWIVSKVTATWGALIGGESSNADALHTHDFEPTGTAAGLLAVQKGAANGLASLDENAKVVLSQLPSIAIVEVTAVADETAQLALTAQKGDVAVREDENKSYMHNGGTAGDMTDWTLLATPTDVVLSVAGLTGAISAGSLRTAINVEDGAQVNTIASVAGLTGTITVAALQTALSVPSTAADVGAVPMNTGTSLPAAPSNGDVCILTAADATNKAAKGRWSYLNGNWHQDHGEVYAGGTTGATYTIPSLYGQTIRLTLGAATTFTLPTAVPGACFGLEVTNIDTYSPGWPAGLLEDEGGALASATGYTILYFHCDASSNWVVGVVASGVA